MSTAATSPTVQASTKYFLDRSSMSSASTSKPHKIHSTADGRIRFANAPISFGINEFGIGSSMTSHEMLDQLCAAGYSGSELGDLGFFQPVARPEELASDLFSKRGLGMIGAFVAYSLWDKEAHGKGREYALKVGRLLRDGFVNNTNINKQNKKNTVLKGSSFDYSIPHLVLSDSVVAPHRIKNTGRITSKDGLSPEKWDILVQEVKDLKKLVKEETGLEIYYHSHCGSFVEAPWELERLLTDVPDLKLIVDTAHITMGAHSKPYYLIQLLNTYGPSRIHSFHFKDYTPISTTVGPEGKFKESDGRDYFELVNNGCFPELGRGVCDFEGVRQWMEREAYEGWIVVEQDVLGDGKDTGKGGEKTNGAFMSALRNRWFLTELFSKEEGRGKTTTTSKL